jgi:hypothetical protein
VTDVYVTSDNIITPLGFSTPENALNMLADKTGIRLTEDEKIAPGPFYASLLETSLLHDQFAALDDHGKFSGLNSFSSVYSAPN